VERSESPGTHELPAARACVPAFTPARELGSEGLLRLLRGAEEALGSLSPLHLGQLDQENTIGSFRLGRRLAVGGMGVVYEAEQQSPARRVALKLIPPGLLTKEGLRRFQFETELLGRLEHPAIARLYCAGCEQTIHGEEIPYFVMELVEGALPITTYAATYRLRVEARLSLLLACCDAVGYGHRHGVIHRDIKPSNVLVSSAGKVKVIDFGIARVTQPDLGLVSPTERSDWLGTVEYAAPERLGTGADSPDTRCDVYSLGVMLFELLVGQRPSPSDCVQPNGDVSLARVDATLRYSELHRRGLRYIVKKSLARDPTERYGSADELGEDLRRCLAGIQVRASGPTLTERSICWMRQNRQLAALCALAAALLVSSLLSASFRLAAASARRDASWQAYSRHLSQAGQALSAGSEQRGLAASLLRDTSPELRGWEHRLLSSLTAGEEWSTSWPVEPTALALSGDGRRLFVGDDSGQVSEVEYGVSSAPRPIATLLGPIVSVEVGPDDRHLLLSDRTGHVELHTLDGSEEPLKFAARCACFAVSERQIALGFDDRWQIANSLDGSIEFSSAKIERFCPTRIRWNPFEREVVAVRPLGPTGASRHSLTGQTWNMLQGFGRVLDAQWLDRSGRMIVLTATNGPMFWTDGVTAPPPPRMPVLSADCAAIDRDGRIAVLGTSKGIVFLVETTSRNTELRVCAHLGPVTCVAISSSRRAMASAGTDRFVRVWPTSREALTARTVQRPGLGHLVKLTCSRPSTRDWISVTEHGFVTESGLEDGAIRRLMPTPGYRPTAIAAEPTSSRVAIGFEDEASWLCDLETKESSPLPLRASSAIGLEFLSAGQLVVLSQNGDLSRWATGGDSAVWVTPLGEIGAAPSRHERRIRPLADGRLLVLLASGHTAAQIVDATSGQILESIHGSDRFRPESAISISPDLIAGRWLVLTSEGTLVRLENRSNGARVLQQANSPAAVSLVTSPTGDGLLTISRSGVLTFVREQTLSPFGSYQVFPEGFAGCTVIDHLGSLAICTSTGRAAHLLARPLEN